MFETQPKRPSRFLALSREQGAVSTWTLTLPNQLRTFDYTTISDVILHVRYTAREAGDPLGSEATTELISMMDTAGQSGQFCCSACASTFPPNGQRL